MRTVAIIQARLSSSRLPGKVLMEIAGKPMIARVVERTARACALDGVLVATSDDASDDPLAGFCRDRAIPVCRGPLDDVLARFATAAEASDAEVIVRITGDCPLIDPALIDAVVALRAAQSADYASNVFARRFPRGLDLECFTRAALVRAEREAALPHQREHVTPYFYEVPGRFRTASLEGEADCGRHRWTVDTQADLDVVRAIYAQLSGPLASWREALEIVERAPELARRNAHIVQKPTRAPLPPAA